MEKESAGLTQSTSELLKNVHRQTRKIADTAANVSRGFQEVKPQQETPLEAQRAPVTAADADKSNISLEAQMAAQNQEAAQPVKLEESMIQMLEAKTAYTASLKALDVVNDMQQESVDILK